MCGRFLLAEAGLLNGRRATTHWKFGRELAARYPGVRVEHDPLWVKDGNIYTSAGISAGIDLALAWVEEDCGAGLAHEAARELVLFLRRPGGQPQVSVSLASQASEMTSIRELQIWIAEHLETRLSVEDLADRMSMSVRNFERVFTREVGTTPSQYVLQMRVEAARRQLERTDGGLKQVASAAGFGSVDVMRRAFVRLLGITPRRYRELAERGVSPPASLGDHSRRELLGRGWSNKALAECSIAGTRSSHPTLCHPEVADAPKPLWRRRERSDEGSRFLNRNAEILRGACPERRVRLGTRAMRCAQDDR